MGRGLDGFCDARVALCSFEGPGEVVSRLFPVALARGKHLFPFRTEKLSPSAPMVLGPRGPGRVGRRRFSSRVACGRPVVVLLARERVGRAEDMSAPPRSPIVHSWSAGAGCRGRLRAPLAAATPRSGVRRMAAHAVGSFSSTSQSTSWSPSSRRNERVSRRAPSARCVSADVLTEGNMCSQAKNGSGRTGVGGPSRAGRCTKARIPEPFCGARAATIVAAGVMPEPGPGPPQTTAEDRRRAVPAMATPPRAELDLGVQHMPPP
jgi:hypothetical protein